MTEEVLQKLKDAFVKGCTDTEACLYAEIAPRTLYNYLDNNKDYAEKRKVWKEHPTMKARWNVSEEIQKGDKETSKWYLERKKKQEFSLRQELTGKDGETFPQTIVIHAKGNTLPPNPETGDSPQLSDGQGN